MSKPIHQPRLIKGKLPYGKGKVITQEVVSDKEILATEHWNKEPGRAWIDAGVYTAKKGYKGITRWKLGGKLYYNQDSQ